MKIIKSIEGAERAKYVGDWIGTIIQRGIRLIMEDHSTWFHPYAGSAPIREH